MADVAIIGAGSWGIALAKVLHTNGNKVTVWSIVEDEITMLKEKHEHVQKLPGVKLPEDMEFTTDLESPFSCKAYLILAVPSVFTRSTAKSMAPFVKEGQIIVCVAKGIEEETLMPLTDIVEQEIPQAEVAVMCGPSHAEEVGIGLPTTVVAGAKKRAVAEEIQDIFMNNVFRVYTSPDVLGMELGGSLKNVIALAAGMADGLGYGDNTKAALITRGMFEMNKLAVTMGAKQETLNGLTGIGDLIVTCESKHSRNRKAGMLIGQGYTMQQAMDEVKMVVEGVYSAKAAIALAKKYGVDMPIIEEVNKVLFEDKPAGKTTTLQTITGMLQPKAGEIIFEGKDISKIPGHKIVSMGMAHVPEGRRVFAELSVYENLKLGAYTRKDKKEIEETLARVYKSFPRLEERKNQLAGTLSGGEQQMLAMGRALMSKPKIILMDEPSMGLSPIFVNEIFDIIRAVSESGTPVLLVEQNAKKALSIADRGYVLETGKIIMEGKGKDLLTDPRVKAAYLGA